MLYATDRTLSIFLESWKVAKSVLFATVGAALVIFMLQIQLFSRSIFIISALCLLMSLSLWRILKRLWIRNLIQNGRLSRNVLLVGNGKKADELADEINNSPFLGLKIAGLINESGESGLSGQKIIGRIKDIERISKKFFIEEIILTEPVKNEEFAFLTQAAHKMNIGLRLMVDDYGAPFERVAINYVGYLPLITYHEKAAHGTDKIAKRAFDIAVSSLILFVTFPLLLIIALLIKIDSSGPIFYVSRRCGKNGIVFNFYKFRSMHRDAHEAKEGMRHKSEVRGPIFKIRKDPRITRVGSFIRRFSIDELPQLFNVIRGDMSLVGPRPPTPDEVEKYEFWQMQRLSVTPGITCLWQVRGRSELSFYKWTKLDIWYINNWSFGLDLIILWQTIPAVLKGRGAY
jgi:exopolysaccharide biosynthesis polyprenyl glycosylphosphotransferase